MATASLSLRLNGGGLQSGGITAAIGDSVQLTSTDKSGWGIPATVWTISSFPPGFGQPVGWSTDADGRYYYQGTTDPPSFTASIWGKYMFELKVLGGKYVDRKTAIKIQSTSGLEDVARGEDNQFGGLRDGNVAAQRANLRLIEDKSFGASEAYAAGAVVLDGNKRITYTGPAAAFLTRAASGHKPGSRVLYEFPAGSTSSLKLSPDFNVKNCSIDPATNLVTDWNAAVPNLLALEQGITLTGGTIIQCAVPDTTPPTVVSSRADATNADAVTVVFSKPVSVKALTGLSLSFSVGTPRTITAIESGDGTSTVTFTLSGNLSSSDVLSFVVGSTRVAADYSDNLVATSTTSVKWGLVSRAAWTRCWEAGVAMLPASGLPADFTSWTDQTGGVLQFTQAGAGHASRTSDPAVKFTNDSTQRLHCNTSPVSGSDFALFGRYKFTSVAVQDWIPFCYDTDGATSKWVRIICTDNATTTTVQLSIYDGTTEHTASDSYTSDTNYHSVFIWRTGGTIYMQIDSRTPVSVSDSLVVTALSNVSIGNLVYAGPTSYKPGNGSVSDLALKAGAAFIGTEKADIIAYIGARP